MLWRVRQGRRGRRGNSVPDVRPGDVTRRGAWRWAAVAVLALMPLAYARAEIHVLLTGDRISGKPVGKGKSAATVETQFGRLVLPRSRIQRSVKPDGTEEVATAPLTVAMATLAPAPPRPAARPRLRIATQAHA